MDKRESIGVRCLNREEATTELIWEKPTPKKFKPRSRKSRKRWNKRRHENGEKEMDTKSNKPQK